MIIFITLLTKLIPLYLIIFLGYIAGKYLRVKKESIAPLLIYIIAPVIVFNGVVTTKLTLGILSLPILFFILCCCMCLVFYKIAGFIWKDTTKNILAFTAGDGNTGYFGLPVAIILFDKSTLGIVVLSILGFLLFENSLGFFITAKGHHTAKESINKLLKLPTIYAFLLGIIINVIHVPLSAIYIDAVTNFRGAYTILGMMIIGLGIASITGFRFDIKFIGISFLAKFLVWPLLVGGIIFVDNNLFHIYGATIHRVMILMAIVPLAANTITLATLLNTQPEKASLAVLLSTIFALFYIPLVVMMFLK